MKFLAYSDTRFAQSGSVPDLEREITFFCQKETIPLVVFLGNYLAPDCPYYVKDETDGYLKQRIEGGIVQRSILLPDEGHPYKSFFLFNTEYVANEFLICQNEVLLDTFEDHLFLFSSGYTGLMEDEIATIENQRKKFPRLCIFLHTPIRQNRNWLKRLDVSDTYLFLGTSLLGATGFLKKIQATIVKPGLGFFVVDSKETGVTATWTSL